MRIHKTVVVLLALLLAGMAFIPIVSGEEQAVDSIAAKDFSIQDNYRHHEIPDDYLKDSKPAEWLPDSEMTNIIVSQKSLEQYGQDSKSPIIEIPLKFLESRSNFLSTEKYSGYKIESSIGPDDSIVLIRMPTQMYETFIKEDVDGKLTLPSAYFCRFYSNLADLSSHMTKDGDGVVKITPSDRYPVPRLSDDNTNPNTVQEFSLINRSSSSRISQISDIKAASSSPQEYLQWVQSWRTSSTNYKYAIGQIRPYSWSLSGSTADLFKLFHEREYKFNNGEALEIVAHFHDRNGGAGIELYPALYRSGASDPIGISSWSHWGGYIPIDPNDIPHSYGYHVQITNSGSGYQVNFEDMETSSWINYHSVAAGSTASSFTELDGSSEYSQINVPSTGTFSATTNPVIDEWIIDVNDGWHKPNAVWTTPVSNPSTPLPYVSVVPSWDSNGNLITRSYANYP